MGGGGGDLGAERFSAVCVCLHTPDYNMGRCPDVYLTCFGGVRGLMAGV